MATNVQIQMADGTVLHTGDTRAFTATVTDAADTAAAPTQIKMRFVPPSGSANQTVYAKTPGSGETSFTSSTSNTFTANHTFDEAGWWDIVTTGSGNMNEVDHRRVYIERVP